MESSVASTEKHCYCAVQEVEFYMITCNTCKKKFHPTCLQSGRPSPIAGDIYFNFTCASCSPTGMEVLKRMKLQWTLVIMLALYNLQLEGSGKCGYFRWRDHICRYIDKHWGVIFGEDRKKSATWHGTVAGALSTGANRFFISGCDVLGETGWWSLKSSRMPALEELDAIALSMKTSRKRKNPAEPEQVVLEGGRRKSQNVVEAAVALKEKQSTIDTFDLTPVKVKKKRSDQSSKQNFDYSIFPPNHKLKFIVDSASTSSSFHEDSLSPGISKFPLKSERISPVSFSFEDPNFNLKESEVDLDMPSMYNIDLFNDLDVPDTFLDDTSEMNSETSSSIKQEPESDTESICDKTVGTPKKMFPDTSRKRTVITKEESPVKESKAVESKYRLLSVYEEEAFLQKLEENYQLAMSETPQLRQLYRKLKIRKLKRERNLPLFDIDAEVRSIAGMDPPDYIGQETKQGNNSTEVIHVKTIFDRFQTKAGSIINKADETTSFMTRLMGRNEDQLETIISPYSGRKLKPFIFRDYKTKPLKLKLLEEIQFRANRNNKEWVKPKQYPIDYCYVRPEFIPSINMMCHEFFWPGIDMQECLQYPDFSCVALYRKIIIGFAFMVPDVNYIEAYITFIFCHPEWRSCGISTFMLYHLIQTCMGKDITLHVSATSPAIFLYQKFCFKIEEFIHDFYDKYLPADSKECRHAFFLRLTR